MEKKRIGIIGGGISGTCLGYHLSLYDNAEVIVFEKATIGGASTAKSAGTVCLFDDSLKNRYWDVRLYGFESYLKMEAEEKGSAGFDKTGTLVVATNEQVEATIKTGIALAKAAGYSGEYITAAGCRRYRGSRSRSARRRRTRRAFRRTRPSCRGAPSHTPPSSYRCRCACRP